MITLLLIILRMIWLPCCWLSWGWSNYLAADHTEDDLITLLQIILRMINLSCYWLSWGWSDYLAADHPEDDLITLLLIILRMIWLPCCWSFWGWSGYLAADHPEDDDIGQACPPHDAPSLGPIHHTYISFTNIFHHLVGVWTARIIAANTLLEKFWWISLKMTDAAAVAKLCDEKFSQIGGNGPISSRIEQCISIIS